ncbi:FAD/NAD(P)-binding domain-containing protein [Lepidopterella palustris CBS 459.81]|uniref:FAD/NAD(P)-binding domain-containing protein n=1 Tax=Lepidopterella palustris CBS 459.81 TaxID=1314670 RepID=A0A8E2E6G4_9PEZI|nr:FAD/NAD(P)-binding domain-containing protein [Lepidopterella palustris CBS 459.81]
MAPGKPFKAIIIGGSVSGMTMAHMLERAGIDYIVLERGSEVTFNGGASIGLQPHGLRIMDQMGMYEDILKTTTPMALACHRLPNGKAFARSEFTLEIEERHGYPILFFERAEMLEILYKHLPDKSKILCSKKVVDIQSNSEGAVATTADGTSYSADMIIGADGVHSTTRQAMWKIMEKTEPNLVKKERSSMFSEYACAFGVSIYDSPDEDLKPGYSHINYEEQRSHICIVSTRKRKFWFLIVKHDKRYYTPNIPRFTPADTEAIIHKNSDIRVTERTTLGDLWKHRSKCSMVSLEEVMFNRWYEDRLVLLGDAVHKVTPNAGHGGNTAIESAAVLANLLYDAKNAPSGRKSLTHKGLLAVFREYQASRMARVANACEKSSMATRLQAMDSMLWKNLALRIVPALGESMEVNAASALIIGGEPLKSVEYKGKQGSIPWDGWDSAQEYQPRKNTFFTGALQSRRFLAVLLAIAWALQHQYAPPAIPVLQHTDGVGMEPYLSNNKTGAFSGWLQEYGASTMPTNPWNTLESSVQMLSIGVILAVEQFRGFSAKKHHVEYVF